MTEIDLNCDLGEGVGNDPLLMPLVTSANIACGGHAGDATTMREAVRLAVRHSVSIGAHPSYDDRVGFGRRPLALPPADVGASVLRQLRALEAIVAAEGVTLRHVKPHGALYHAADTDDALAREVLAVVAIVDPKLIVVGPPAGRLAEAAAELGLRFVAEGFIDRRYRPDGRLVPRGDANATIDDADAAADQALSIVLHGHATADDGRPVALAVRTLGVHGDGPHAAGVLAGVRQRLRDHGVGVRPFGSSGGDRGP